MTTRQWNRTDEVTPPEGVVLDTVSPGGTEQQLLVERGLWFFPDKSMYVYYVPQLWAHP